MTETAKELIENEIKSVEKRLHRGRNDGKTYNTGVKEGLMIARAHVIDSSTTDKLSVEKLQEQLNTAKKALKEIAEIINDDIHECDYSCDNHCELNGSLNIYRVENLKSVTESALAEIGDEGSGNE